jgi:hypothetical protein
MEAGGDKASVRLKRFFDDCGNALNEVFDGRRIGLEFDDQRVEVISVDGGHKVVCAGFGL